MNKRMFLQDYVKHDRLNITNLSLNLSICFLSFMKHWKIDADVNRLNSIFNSITTSLRNCKITIACSVVYLCTIFRIVSAHIKSIAGFKNRSASVHTTSLECARHIA